MHAGIVEHHNGEGVWILLDHKLVKRFAKVRFVTLGLE
jgi:hypothetical protein